MLEPLCTRLASSEPGVAAAARDEALQTALTATKAGLLDTLKAGFVAAKACAALDIDRLDKVSDKVGQLGQFAALPHTPR